MYEPIAAIATGRHPCAIGIVRLSGDGCFALCDRVFRAPSGTPFSRQTARKLVLGDILDAQGRVLDRGLAVRFPGPGSYTGEDCAEFHCHGSPVVLRELLDALFQAGARQARAGEFTKRAFLNGRMDLTQAEAVVDLIDAETAAAARNAAAQLDGGLRRVLEPVQNALLDTASRFYAVVDYPDEAIEDAGPEEINHALETAGETLDRLLSACRRGRVLKSGVRTAILGRPNTGKSSLLNALAGYDRAIVTDIPGTTRDTVEESVVCGGVLLRLTDTAGLRETGDAVEKLGVARTRQAAEQADLLLAVFDAAAPWTEEDQEAAAFAASRGTPWIAVWNKTDLPHNPDLFPLKAIHPETFHPETFQPETSTSKAFPSEAFPPEAFPLDSPPSAVVTVSAKTGAGLSDLEEAVMRLFPPGETDTPGTLLTDARQEDAAARSRDAVRRAREALEAGFSPDAVLTDVEEALDAVGELTGRTAKEEIVSRIFSRFCVGK